MRTEKKRQQFAVILYIPQTELKAEQKAEWPSWLLCAVALSAAPSRPALCFCGSDIIHSREITVTTQNIRDTTSRKQRHAVDGPALC